MKICTRCHEIKPLDSFYSDVRYKDGHINQCIKCILESSRKWRANNVEKRKEQYTKNMNRYRKIRLNYLLNHPCIDCGEADVRVLEFDHVKGKKFKSICLLWGSNEQTILREIDKCVVRCRNCHRKKTTYNIRINAKYSSYDSIRRQRKYKQIQEYLYKHPCVDCGNSDIDLLEFDHVRGEKIFEISAGRTRSSENLALEMAKCDVRCANCHTIQTIYRRQK